MPPIFKAMVSITVWVLFIYGCLGVLGGLVLCIMRVSGGTTVPFYVALLHPFIGVSSLILSAVAAWLRKALE